MKIQLLSDTHGHDYELSPEADVVVHAGDFSNTYKDAIEFYNRCTDLGLKSVFALGNNDYNGSVISSVIDELVEQGLPVLTHSNSIEIDGFTFVGGTLFTNFRRDPRFLIKHCMDAATWTGDFRKNKVTEEVFATPFDYINLFDRYYENINKFRNTPNTIVVTHFPPHLACLDPYWSKHPTASLLNPFYVNDLDVSGFTHWFSGHVHTAVDTTVGGCRLVVNPLGHEPEHGKTGYRSNLLIEV